MNLPSTGRPVIAVLGSQLNHYQKPVVSRLRDVLHEEGYGLVFVSGGALKPEPDWDERVPVMRNAIYQLARDFPVDGYIILTATIGNHASAERLNQFVHDFSHKPVVCYGIPVRGVSSVKVDNHAGMTQLMEHLTDSASRRRFVFIRGYPDSPESQQRECAFREVLASRNLPVDESLILDGNFVAADAFHEMDDLLKRTRDFDAVVAANDKMAQSAIHALMKHDLRTPDDVVVSGFGDGAAASASLPPLTTVQYSRDEMITRAVQSLKAQMSTGVYRNPNNEAILVPHNVVIRASTLPAARASAARNERDNVFDAFEFKKVMLDNLRSLVSPEGLNPDLVVTEIVSILVNGTDYSGTNLDRALRDLHERPGDIYWWRHLHEQITANLQHCGSRGQSGDALASTMSILGQIHKSIWSVERRIQVENALFYESTYEVRAKLNNVASMDELLDTLANLSKVFPTRSAFMCIYDCAGSFPDDSAKVIYSWPPNCLNHDCSLSFPCRDILPGGYMQSTFPGPLIIEPLCSGRIHLGYVVLDLDGHEQIDNVNVAALADSIASVLWRCQSINLPGSVSATGTRR